jgi:hypothetical protein
VAFSGTRIRVGRMQQQLNGLFRKGWPLWGCFRQDQKESPYCPVGVVVFGQ